MLIAAKSSLPDSGEPRVVDCSILKMTQVPQVPQRFRFALSDRIGKKDFLSSPDPNFLRARPRPRIFPSRFISSEQASGSHFPASSNSLALCALPAETLIFSSHPTPRSRGKPTTKMEMLLSALLARSAADAVACDQLGDGVAGWVDG